MAVIRTKRIDIFGLKDVRKPVIEYLQKSENVEIEDINAKAQGIFSPDTVKKTASFNEYLALATKALEILNKYSPEKKGMFSKREMMGEEKYSMTSDETERVGKHIREIINAEKSVRDNLESVGKIELKQLQISPFSKLDVPMNLKETQSVCFRTGTFEGEFNEADLIQLAKENNIEEIHFEVLSKSKQQTCVFTAFSKDKFEQTNKFLRSTGFVEPSFSLSHRTVKEKIEALEAEKKELLKKNEELEKSFGDFLKYRREIELFYDRLVMRKEKYEALSKIGETENIFIITGFVEEKNGLKIKEDIENKYDVVCEISEGDETPAIFKNNAFVEPVEGITSDYSMPSKNDIDPNPVMAFFYYFFFGMMFSDAGYGLLMMIVCGILGYSNVLEKAKRRAYKMFFCCGVSTTFWGIMYGSFFGDMIDTVARVFFNSPVKFNPVLLNPTKKPLELLIISVAFGMVHILTALAINFHVLWKKGEKTDAVCDTGFWFLALLGICFVAAGAGLKIQVLNYIAYVLMGLGFGGLLVTGGRNSKNIIGKIFGGVLKLYDITSYVGDALSYSRLMALGLATGVIASVINVLGSLGGATFVGVLAYIVISIFGHLLNFAINCLGAYVHTNRLQYVEFYQKFYEGGGRKFTPLAMNTKYYNFSNNN